MSTVLNPTQIAAARARQDEITRLRAMANTARNAAENLVLGTFDQAALDKEAKKISTNADNLIANLKELDKLKRERAKDANYFRYPIWKPIQYLAFKVGLGGGYYGELIRISRATAAAIKEQKKMRLEALEDTVTLSQEASRTENNERHIRFNATLAEIKLRKAVALDLKKNVGALTPTNDKAADAKRERAGHQKLAGATTVKDAAKGINAILHANYVQNGVRNANLSAFGALPSDLRVKIENGIKAALQPAVVGAAAPFDGADAQDAKFSHLSPKQKADLAEAISIKIAEALNGVPAQKVDDAAIGRFAQQMCVVARNPATGELTIAATQVVADHKAAQEKSDSVNFVKDRAAAVENLTKPAPTVTDPNHVEPAATRAQLGLVISNLAPAAAEICTNLGGRSAMQGMTAEKMLNAAKLLEAKLAQANSPAGLPATDTPEEIARSVLLELGMRSAPGAPTADQIDAMIDKLPDKLAGRTVNEAALTIEASDLVTQIEAAKGTRDAAAIAARPTAAKIDAGGNLVANATAVNIADTKEALAAPALDAKVQAMFDSLGVPPAARVAPLLDQMQLAVQYAYQGKSVDDAGAIVPPPAGTTAEQVTALAAANAIKTALRASTIPEVKAIGDKLHGTPALVDKLATKVKAQVGTIETSAITDVKAAVRDTSFTAKPLADRLTSKMKTTAGLSAADVAQSKNLGEIVAKKGAVPGVA